MGEDGSLNWDQYSCARVTDNIEGKEGRGKLELVNNTVNFLPVNPDVTEERYGV